MKKVEEVEEVEEVEGEGEEVVGCML